MTCCNWLTCRPLDKIHEHYLHLFCVSTAVWCVKARLFITLCIIGVVSYIFLLSFTASVCNYNKKTVFAFFLGIGEKLWEVVNCRKLDNISLLFSSALTEKLKIYCIMMQIKFTCQTFNEFAWFKECIYSFRKESGIFHTDLYFLQWHDGFLLL